MWVPHTSASLSASSDLGWQALDVAYAVSYPGISLTNVETLCSTCRILHLDISQTIQDKRIDFASGVRVLVNHAPQLQSLAVHGLQVGDKALLDLACVSWTRIGTPRQLDSYRRFASAGLESKPCEGGLSQAFNLR